MSAMAVRTERTHRKVTAMSAMVVAVDLVVAAAGTTVVKVIKRAMTVHRGASDNRRPACYRFRHGRFPVRVQFRWMWFGGRFGRKGRRAKGPCRDDNGAGGN